MFGLFKRTAATANAAPGGDVLAVAAPAGSVVPAECVGVAGGSAGELHRVAAGARLPAAGAAWCFHPGPHAVRFAPFAAAPELGLHLVFAVDAPNPRVVQQRFDLFLACEVDERITMSAFAALLADTVQRELAQGNLDLPPCTTAQEWHAFRAGLNRILYQRFGITLDDCMPVDLGEEVDYAQQLRQRAAVAAAGPSPAAIVRAAPVKAADALALRRLFLELPALASGLRLVPLPEGQGLFRQQQHLLQRLDHVALQVDTMPALGLARPGAPLAPDGQALRAAASGQAVRALDDAWSLLARLGDRPAALLDEADRVVANLELHCAARRGAP